MKSRTIVLTILLTTMLLLAGSVSATMGIDEKKLVTVHIDDYGRLWWQPGHARPDSLPKLLPGLDQGKDLNTYKLDTAALFSALLEQAHAKPRLVLRIIARPKADYRVIDQLLLVLDRVVTVINDSVAHDAGVSIDALPIDRLFRPRGGFDRWEMRDDKILEYAQQAAGVQPPGPSLVPSQDTYAFREPLGYWERKWDLLEPVGPRLVLMPLVDPGDSSVSYPDVLPKFRIAANPAIPDSAQKTELPHTVTVSVVVSPTGEPSQAELVFASNDSLIDSPVLEAAGRCLFTPGLRDGEPVASRVAFTYTNKPDALGGFVIDNPTPTLAYVEEPVYPDSLHNAGIGGKVYIRLTVGLGGLVGKATIARSSGEPLLDTAALEVARKCQFRPGIPNENFRETWVIIPYEFIPQASR